MVKLILIGNATMGNCERCGFYFSIEDLIRMSLKCSIDGLVSIVGILVNFLTIDKDTITIDSTEITIDQIIT